MNYNSMLKRCKEDKKDKEVDIKEYNETIRQLWLKIFPNSNILISKNCLGSGYHFRCTLARDKSEVFNGIILNDALNYVFSIEENNYLEYHNLSIYIKPENKYLAYSRVKLRIKNIKNITLEKLEKRFIQVKQLIVDNKDNFKDLQFDINNKI